MSLYKRLIIFLIAVLIAGCAAPTSAITATPEISLTPEITLTVELPDPAEVVQAFWDALKVNDIDLAMTYVADDIKCGGQCYMSGRESFRSFLVGRSKTGIVFEINHLQVEGDTVTYLSDQYSEAGFLHEKGMKETMRVQNGKIIYWEAS